MEGSVEGVFDALVGEWVEDDVVGIEVGDGVGCVWRGGVVETEGEEVVEACGSGTREAVRQLSGEEEVVSSKSEALGFVVTDEGSVLPLDEWQDVEEPWSVVVGGVFFDEGAWPDEEADGAEFIGQCDVETWGDGVTEGEVERVCIGQAELDELVTFGGGPGEVTVEVLVKEFGEELFVTESEGPCAV